MKAVIIGLGSIGNRYADILLNHFKLDVYALREKNKISNEIGVKEIFSFNDLEIIKPDFIIISNPTFLHLQTAVRCSNYCKKILIEKPLDCSLNELEKFIKIIKENSIVTYVAYNLRFHPVLQKIKEYLVSNNFLHLNASCSSYLPNWRPNTDHRKNYSANKEEGGGVVLDLSHEIDYISYLLGDLISIKGISYKKSKITNDSEDFADLLLKCEKGEANVHLSYFSHFSHRTIQIDFNDFTVVGDIINYKVSEYKEGKLIKTIEFDKKENDSYIKQIDYFINNLDNIRMMNNVFEAGKMFKKIMNFKKGLGI